MVQDVRALFFNALTLLLRPALQKDINGKRKYFNDVGDAREVQNVFNKYFKRDKLIEDVAEGTEFEAFAVKLVDSGAFQHFMDDSFTTEFTNIAVFDNIINAGDIKE